MMIKTGNQEEHPCNAKWTTGSTTTPPNFTKIKKKTIINIPDSYPCLLYTSDAADE